MSTIQFSDLQSHKIFQFLTMQKDIYIGCHKNIYSTDKSSATR
ncbi:hypothetical protein UABAM_04713 [Candidatus Uabimicrobium amorphum]|uniref:Uncharacterized protein n=1 Tax=Uabimicrobium amorphum TaxID=2596890 RepID=A0A5S9IRD7_UABAM|nr:hypothetical protein UABAM_04713 [Candidatus Uabimicrobium amorphum]